MPKHYATSVTVANLRPREWGVWSNDTHDLVGFLMQRQKGGFWRMYYANGEIVNTQGFHTFMTFKGCRKAAQHFEGWPNR